MQAPRWGPPIARPPSELRWLGCPLLLPAAVLWLLGLVLPTLATLVQSLERSGALGIQPGAFVGFANWGSLARDREFWHALGLSLGVAALRVVAAGLVPPALAVSAALLVRASSRDLGVVARVLLALPVAIVAPVPVAITWLLWLISRHAGLGGGGAVLLLLFIDAISSLAWTSGLALFTYLAALRAVPGLPIAPQLRRRPFLVLWVATLLGAGASGLQSFVLPSLLTGGGPGDATTTLGLLGFRLGFQTANAGAAQAVAVVQLIPVLAFGLCAGGLVLAGPLRLVVRTPAGREGRRPLLWGAGTLVLLTVLLAVVLLAGGGADYRVALRETQPYASTMSATLLPPLAAAVLLLVAVTPAAFGLGFLRPLGGASGWLLLPFCPWLFVGSPPLLLTAYLASRGRGLGVLAGLLPVLPLAVPSLLVLTLLFGGLRRAWEAGRGRDRPAWFRDAVVAPALPVIGVLLGAAWMIGAQSYAWPLVTQTSGRWTSYTLVLSALPIAVFRPGVLRAALALYGAPLALLFFCLLGAYQAFFGERLALESDETPGTPYR